MGFTIRGAIVFAVVVAAGGRGARAESTDSDTLRLADVIAAAVRQSPDLERARIDVAAARAQLLRAEGVEDTHLGVVVNAALTGAAPGDPLASSDSEHVQASISRTLPTGGKLSVAASGDRLSNSGVQRDANGNQVQAQVFRRYTTQLIAELVQPLLRGAGAEAYEAPIRQAERQRDAAALTHEAKARDLVVSLAQAYWQVAFAWRQLEVRKASLELADKQLAYTEGAIRSEKVARSEALAVQEAIAVRKQDVIAGEQDVYDRSVALRQLGGLEIGPDALAVKTEALPAKIEPAALDLAAILRGAYDHSAELAALEATRRAAELAAAAADNAARSRLDLDVAGGPIGADTTALKALASATKDPGYLVTVGLTFDHAFERRTERGGQDVARAALLAARVAERDGRARLAMRATRAVQRAKAALASIALGTEAIGLAEQNVAAEQKRFELGKTTNFEVLRRQDELEQARLRHASAVADYVAARVELDGLSGAILARYGIVMP
jgi:outer membrane protein TolC